MRSAPREGVGDADLAVRAALDEILARERLKRAIGIDPEPLGRRVHLAAVGAAHGCEIAHDPEVEFALRIGEPCAPGLAELRGRDLCRRERRGHAPRQLAGAGGFAVDAQVAASVRASRTQLSCGCSATPPSLR